MRNRTVIPIGSVFNRLTILSLVIKNTRSFYLCKCSCGNEVVVYGSDLRNGNTQSCGCLRLERLAVNRTKIDRSKLIKHGMHGTPTYHSWASMLQRCKHPEKTYLNGKNIKVVNRWKKFENFLTDMGEKPAGLSLDRIDNSGDYKPSNCRWATRSQQNSNQQKVRKGEMRMLKNFTKEELLAELAKR